MRSTHFLLVLLTGVALTTACGDSSDPVEPSEDVTLEDLVGSWNATSQIFTNNADPSQEFDWIAAGGETRFTMLTGGRTRTWTDLDPFQFHDEWDALVTLNSADMTLTSTPAEPTRSVQHFTFSLDGNTLTLTESDANFDFTMSGGTGVSATMVAVFTRTAQ